MAEWKALKDDWAVIENNRSISASFDKECRTPNNLIINSNSLQEHPYIVVQSMPHSYYYCKELMTASNRVLADFNGFENIISQTGDTEFFVYVGYKHNNGMSICALKRNSSKEQDKLSDEYFADNRSKYSEPFYAFDNSKNETVELLAVYVGGNERIKIIASEKSNRFEEQLTCIVDDFEFDASNACIDAVIRTPVSMSECPIGVGIGDSIFETSVASQDYANKHKVPVKIDLASLNTNGQSDAPLYCAYKYKNEIFKLPVRIRRKELASEIQQIGEFKAVCKTADDVNAYLYVDSEHRICFKFTNDVPGGQSYNYTNLSDYLDSDDRHSEYGITAFRSDGKDWKWTVYFPTLDLRLFNEACISVEKVDSAIRWDCPIIGAKLENKGCKLTVDLSDLKDLIDNSKITSFFVYFAARKNNKFFYLPLLDPVHTIYTKKRTASKFDFAADDLKREVFGTAQFNKNTKIEIYQNWLRRYNTRLFISIGDECRRYMTSFVCRTKMAKIRFGKLKVEIECPNIQGIKWSGIALCYRYKLESDKKDYYLPIKIVGKNNECVTVSAEINLKKLEFAPLYWDIRTVFEKNGNKFLSYVRIPLEQKLNKSKEDAKTKLKWLFVSDTVNINKNYQVALYATANRKLALVCQDRSQYSGFFFRLKERWARFLYNKFDREKIAKEHVMLVYEKYCCMAQDNGFYFFKYCMDNKIEEKLHRKIYFVIDKNAADYKNNLLPYKDHVIQFMSLKHMIYLLGAALLVSSDSKAHAYAWRCKESIIQPQIERNKKLVFLQHGVIALKKVGLFAANSDACDLFITSNEKERDIVIKELGYQPQNVAITGLTRWDVLQDMSDQSKTKTILVMPTWRNWLEEVSDKTFLESDYYKNYTALLNNKALSALLEKNNLCLKFYIHPKFRDYISNFNSNNKRIQLIPFGTQQLNLLIMECSMLVTDYSSVCWDVYYQGKPVVFYQFDLEQYNETQGAYIDLTKDLFGDRVETSDELIALLKKYSDNNFTLDKKYADMRQTMYTYIDTDNSKRVIDEISKRNW